MVYECLNENSCNQVLEKKVTLHCVYETKRYYANKNGNVKTTAVKNSVLYCACRLFTKKVHYKCFPKERKTEAKKGYLLCKSVNSKNLSIFWGTFEIFVCIGK